MPEQRQRSTAKPKPSRVYLVKLVALACFLIPHNHSQLYAATSNNETAMKTTTQLETQTLFEKPAGEACHRIPSLVVSTKGTLLAFCDFRTENPGDHGQRTDLVLRRSTDNGSTWLPVQCLAADPLINHHSGPALVDKVTGRIFKFYRVWPKALNGNPKIHAAYEKDRQQFKKAGYGSFYVFSDDDGLTWSPAVRLDFQVPGANSLHGIGNSSHGIQLESGRLVVHAWAFRKPVTKNQQKTDAVTVLLYSDDHGEHWHCGTHWATSHGCQEICYAEVGTGIYCNARTIGPHRKVGFLNGVENDAQLEIDPNLEESGCHAGLAAEGPESLRLVFSNPPNINTSNKYVKELRHHLTIRLSSDGGKTWPHSRVLEQGLSGYSDLAWHNGFIYCLYEAGTNRYDDEIHFSRFPVEWIIDQ